MAINVPHGKTDEIIDFLIDVLRPYETDHPGSQIDLYRNTRATVRVRIIDPDFAGIDKSRRYDRAWNYLEKLPEEASSDITNLVLITPEERATSMSNLIFESPTPWEF